MENLNIVRDVKDPNLFHLTIDRRTLSVLQAAGRAYKSRLEASCRHYQNHKEELKERRRLAKLNSSPPSPESSSSPTLNILNKVTKYPV